MLNLFKIVEDSLSPAINPGDFVLTLKLPPKPGDVIVFRQPGIEGVLIKRVVSISADGDQLQVAGSHPHSVDSRIFGPVSRSRVIGRVVWHLSSSR
jgi:phage repressor protein C with HTH and peptisase S24 domain